LLREPPWWSNARHVAPSGGRSGCLACAGGAAKTAVIGLLRSKKTPRHNAPGAIRRRCSLLACVWVRAGYGLGRRRFQLYHKLAAPMAAAAKSNQSIGVIAQCFLLKDQSRSEARFVTCPVQVPYTPWRKIRRQLGPGSTSAYHTQRPWPCLGAFRFHRRLTIDETFLRSIYAVLSEG
jgi:hypothetical protein